MLVENIQTYGKHVLLISSLYIAHHYTHIGLEGLYLISGRLILNWCYVREKHLNAGWKVSSHARRRMWNGTLRRTTSVWYDSNPQGPEPFAPKCTAIYWHPNIPEVFLLLISS